MGKLSLQLQHLDKLLNQHSEILIKRLASPCQTKLFCELWHIIYCEASGLTRCLPSTAKARLLKALGEFEHN
jgi:hypothetical protein